jgi:hypothetical protein
MLELTRLCADAGQPKKANSYRERVSEISVLGEDFWLAWVRDEIPRAAGNAQEQKRVLKIFERGLEDGFYV